MSYTLTVRDYYSSNKCADDDIFIWMSMLFGSMFLTYSLIQYMLNYICGGQFYLTHHKQHVFIVRSLPSQHVEEEIVEYIHQANDGRPYKIISNRTYGGDVINVNERVFLRFMKKLMNTRMDIYVIVPNNHRSAYDPYIYFSETLKINYKILDFISDSQPQIKTEREVLDYENRKRIEITL